jgi:hypothetical protein
VIAALVTQEANMRHHAPALRIARASPLLFWLLAPPTLQAQTSNCPPPCDPPACSGVATRGQANWYPDKPAGTWTRDRRPSQVLSFFNGSWFDNFQGLHGNLQGLGPWWWGEHNPSAGPDTSEDLRGAPNGGPNGRPDVFDDLLNTLETSYKNGYRRITLNIPAGVVDCQNVPGAQWGGLSSWRRDWFLKDITSNGPIGVKGWMQSKPVNDPVELAVYLGFQTGASCTLCLASNIYTVPTINPGVGCGGYTGEWQFPCCGAIPAHPVMSNNSADTCTFHQNVEPWIDMGIGLLLFDAAALEFQEFRQFAYSPDYAPPGGARRVKFGGEAFPNGPQLPNGRLPLLTEAFGYGAWIETLILAEQSYENGSIVPSSCNLNTDGQHAWTAPAGSEAVIWFTGFPANCNGPVPGWEPANRLDTLFRYYLSRGFTLGAFVGDTTETAERCLGFGHISSGADFNGDGVVDSADYYRYTEYWNYSQNYTGPGRLTYFHGDMNNDGIVDSTDYFLFINMWQAGSPVPMDLGPITWNTNTTWVAPWDSWHP